MRSGLSVRLQMLTLPGNPITLSNWIGCVHCGDTITAGLCLRRDEGNPLDHHFLFFEV